MRYTSWFVCAVAVLLLPIPAKAFCNEPRPRLVCAEFFANELVVEATLTKIATVPENATPEEGIDAYVYTLRVNHSLRGAANGTLRVYEGNDSGRATFGWVKGKDYLLFLSYVSAKKAWDLDGCGNSGPLDKANAALAEIAAIKTARGGGAIRGRVSDSPQAEGVPGVHVIVEGVGLKLTATTDKQGRFEFKVPAGKYIVRATKGGFEYQTAFLSYEDAQHVVIEPGGCAQIQFSR